VHKIIFRFLGVKRPLDACKSLKNFNLQYLPRIKKFKNIQRIFFPDGMPIKFYARPIF
jgi:hypothetical protein